MNINQILDGTVTTALINEQEDLLTQMKERKIFDLTENEKYNLITFLYEKVNRELSIDYLFHVLDTEISYPIDEGKIKILFSDTRMSKLKDLMLEKLSLDEEEGEC